MSRSELSLGSNNYDASNDVKIQQCYSENTTPLDNRLTDLPPATLAFVPGGFGGIQWVVVGTYLKKEDKKKDKRGYKKKGKKKKDEKDEKEEEEEDGDTEERFEGSVQLYRLDKQTSRLTLFEIFKYPDAGVYFLKFYNNSDILVVGTTAGFLSVFKLVQQTEWKLGLRHDHDIQLFPMEKNIRITSFTWCDPLTSSPPIMAITSNGTKPDDQGHVTIVRFKSHIHRDWEILSTAEGVTSRHQNSRGGYMPAIAYCSFWHNHTLFTGGDEGSIRMNRFTGLPHGRYLCPDFPPREFKDYHIGGVLSILSFEGLIESEDGYQHVLFTGGYDGFLTLSSVSRDNGKKPKVLAQLQIDGNGVYSLVHINSLVVGQSIDRESGLERCKRFLILASCCFAGVRIIEALHWGDDKWDLNVIASVTHHNSLSYASDAVFANGSFTVVSSSYYDKLLCVWRFTDPGLGTQKRPDGYGASELRDESTMIKPPE